MHAWTISAALAGLLSLAACGAGEEAAGDDPSEPASSRPTPTTTPDPQPGMTPPATELEIGDTATVPVRTFQDPVGGTAEITVVSLEDVPAEDVASSGFDADEGTTVHLVRSEATLTEVTDLRVFEPSADLVALTTDGDIATTLSPEDAGLFDCAADAEGSPESGTEVSFCEAFAVAEGGEVDRIQFAPYAGDYSVQEGAPLTWR